MKRWLIIICLVMVVVFACSSCTSQTPAPTTSQPTSIATKTTPASPTPVVAPNAKILKLAYSMQKTGGTGMAFEWFAQQVAVRTNGRYKVDTFPGQTLFKSGEALGSVKSGVADISHSSLAADAKAFPVNTVLTLPSTHFPQTKAGLAASTVATKDLISKYSVMANEFKGFKLYAWVVASAYLPMTKTAKVFVPNDLKGLKIGCEATYFDMIKSVGGVPVAIIPPDMYPALDKSVVDGVMTGYEQLYSLRLDEVLNNFLEYYFAPVIQVVIWNQESWDSLPPDVQKIFTELAPQMETFAHDKAIEQINAAKDRIRSAGGKTIAAPNAEQLKLWDKLVTIPDDTWINNMKTAGVSDAPEILNTLKQRSAEAWSQNK